MKTQVLTVCNLRTLPHALVLRESLRVHHPDWPLHIGLVDPLEAVPDALRIGASLLDVRAIGLPDFTDLAQRYTTLEFTNLTKPFFAQYLLGTQPDLEYLIFLAPETQLFAPLTALHERLQTHALVLTSRLHDRLPGRAGRLEKDFLNTGTYQSGCWALRRSGPAEAFLSWWSDRLIRKGWLRLCEGFGSDQLWLDLAPAYFEGVHLLREPGYAVGTWNRHEQPLSAEGTGYRWGPAPLTTVQWTDDPPLVRVPNAQLRLWSQLRDAYQLRLEANQYADVSPYPPTWGVPFEPTRVEPWRRALARPLRRLIGVINTFQPGWMYR